MCDITQLHIGLPCASCSTSHWLGVVYGCSFHGTTLFLSGVPCMAPRTISNTSSTISSCQSDMCGNQSYVMHLKERMEWGDTRTTVNETETEKAVRDALRK